MIFSSGRKRLLISSFVSMLFPPVCGICKKKINQKYTCEKCSNILQYTMKRELCVRNIGYDVDQLISLFLYQGVIRNCILELKFDGKAYIANTFAQLMGMAFKRSHFEADIVVPVPIHRKRLMERGYNQSELLSRIIAKQLKMTHLSHLLVKVKNNVAQSTLDHAHRKENVSNVYRMNQKFNICGKRILLIDDIYTTGATANECAKVLKENGAQEVICLTIAYAGSSR